MRTLTTLLLAAVALISTSCSKQKNVSGDYIIVGQVGGIGGIADYYIISNGQLKHDTARGPIPDDITKLRFDVVMPDARYQKVAHLKESIPGELLNQNGKEFGLHSHSDILGLVVNTTINGTRYQWSFTDDLSNCSSAIRQFVANAELAFR